MADSFTKMFIFQAKLWNANLKSLRSWSLEKYDDALLPKAAVNRYTGI